MKASPKTPKKIREAKTKSGNEEGRYTLFDNMLEGVQILSHDWRYLYLNATAGQHNRRPNEELLGRQYTEMWPGIEETHVFTVIKRCMEERVASQLENKFIYPDGMVGWFNLSIQPIPEGTLIMSFDITEHKRAEKQIIQMKRLYATLSQVNQTIARVKDRTELYQTICDVAVQFGEFSLAWVGLLDEASGEIRPVAANGLDLEHWPFQEISIHRGDLKDSLSATAVRTSKVVTSEDVETDQRTQSAHDQLGKQDYHSSAAVPFFLKGKPIGILALVSPETGLFKNTEEVRLLEEMGLDISFALDMMETEAERQRAEEKLRNNEQVLRLFVENSPAAVAMFDRDMKYIVASRRYLVDYGLGDQDVIGRSHYEIFPEIPDRWKEIHQRCLAGAVEKADEDPFPRADGKLDWIHWEIRPWYETDGEIGGIILFSEVITDRKEAEERLRKSESRFSTIFENSPIAIGISRLSDRKIIQVNTAFTELYGYSREEAVRHTTAELDIWAIPADRQRFVEQLQTQGHVSSFETIARQKSGKECSVLVSGEIVEINGELCLLTQTVDFTERKRVEEALRESEEKFRSLFEHMQEGIAHCEMIYENGQAKDWVYLAVNESFESLTGLKGVTGKRVTEVIPGIHETDPKLFEIYSRVALTGEPEKFEFFVVALQTWFSVSVYGAKRGFFVAVFDVITERKRSEEKLSASEAKFKAVFDNAPIGISLLDSERRVLESNNMLERIVRMNREGLAAGAYRGRKYIREDGTEILPGELASTRAIVENGPVRDVVNGIVLEDGQTIWTQVSAAPLGLPDPRIVVITQDITARKRAEEELRRIMEELKRSNAELEQFAYVASHDLQEPLRAVTGMVQLLGQRYKGKLDENADEYIGHAVDAATRMQNLINDLLDYSRVERFGKRFEATDLERSLQVTLSNLQVAIEESHARVTHDPLPTVMADPGQMSQLLQNLIGNAIKFRSENPLQIHISAEKVENAWHFSIRDNGIGIEPQYFERIFLVFQRLHTRREYPGTGIGLSLCKRIVERHGGRIWVESQLGLGSTFHFTIPEKRL